MPAGFWEFGELFDKITERNNEYIISYDKKHFCLKKRCFFSENKPTAVKYLKFV